MRNLLAHTSNDLLCQLNGIDISVPPRNKGTTKKYMEKWSICRFLSTFAETSLLDYPIQVHRRERPDYVLSLSSREVGVEITEAIPTNYAWAKYRRAKICPNKATLLERFLPGEDTRSSNEINEIVSGQKHSDGWPSDSPEREWSNAMLYFLKGKIEKFKKPGFDHFEKNWLLIYDNWPIPKVVGEKAVVYFREALAAPDIKVPFDSIFIESSDKIWQVTSKNHCGFTLNDIWS